MTKRRQSKARTQQRINPSSLPGFQMLCLGKSHHPAQRCKCACAVQHVKYLEHFEPSHSLEQIVGRLGVGNMMKLDRRRCPTERNSCGPSNKLGTSGSANKWNETRTPDRTGRKTLDSLDIRCSFQ
jgi:hypothetical protein